MQSISSGEKAGLEYLGGTIHSSNTFSEADSNEAREPLPGMEATAGAPRATRNCGNK